jgi:ribosomal protein L11 methyltransferase
MHVWRKTIPIALIPVWEEAFEGIQDVTLVVTQAPAKKQALIEAFGEDRTRVAGLKKEFGGNVAVVKTENWAALAPPPEEPLKIRDRLVIIGAAKVSEIMAAKARFPGREIIAVPPELAFGSGHHATTATMLRWLVDFADQRKGRTWTMLDLGCGSGILSIAAERMGAASAWGCDFDALAVAAAQRNLRRNRTRRVTLEGRDVTRWRPGVRHDLVIANIFADILTDIFPKLARAVKKDGLVMVSGILHTQAQGCLEAGRRAGLRIERVVRKGKWVSAIASF